MTETQRTDGPEGAGGAGADDPLLADPARPHAEKPELPTTDLEWIAHALRDAETALKVLSTMLASAGLKQGFVVADEILGNVKCAQKNCAHLIDRERRHAEKPEKNKTLIRGVEIIGTGRFTVRYVLDGHDEVVTFQTAQDCSKAYDVLRRTEKAATAQSSLVADLASALKGYGQHKPECEALECAICRTGAPRDDAIHRYGPGVHYFEPKDCTCGLSALLARVSEGQ